MWWQLIFKPVKQSDTLVRIATMTESSTVDQIPISDDAEQKADNGSALSDPIERRRRQNRINQRAHRTSLSLQSIQQRLIFAANICQESASDCH